MRCRRILASSPAFLFLLLALPVGRADESEKGKSSPEPTPALKDVREDDPDYLFMKLGRKQDYLEAERHRIVDQIEQAIPPLYEPVRPFHGYTLPPGVWKIGLSSTFMQNQGDFGTDHFYSQFFDKVHVDRLDTNLDVFYGFELGNARDLTLHLNVPYSFQRHTGTGHPFRINNVVMEMEGAGQGIGDISLTLKKKWTDQANDHFFTFSTMTGVIFPTADDNQRFNNSNMMFSSPGGDTMGNGTVDVFGRTPGDRLFPRGAQPGNGSWGGRFGFGLTRQFERSALHAGALYDLLADNDRITPGNELKYGVSYVLPPTSSDRVTLDLSVFGKWKGDEKFPGMITHASRDPVTGNMGPMETTPRPNFKHGNMTFFSPTLIFIPSPNTRLFVGPSFRIIEPDQGPSPRWQLTAGVTYTF